MKEKVIKLSNGGTLIYSHSNLNNCSAVEVGYLAGAYSENKKGTAHLCEHTLFKKTTNRDSLKIENDRNEIVFINASTSMDYLILNFFRSNKLIEESLDFAQDILINSIIDDEYLETEKGVIKEELNMCLDSEQRDVFILNLTQAQSKASFSSDIIGKTSENIDKIEFNDLLEFKNSNFIGNNFIISISTSLKLRTIKCLVDKYFVSKIPYKNEFKKPKSYFNDLIIDKESSILVETKDQEKATVLISFRIGLGELNLIKNHNYLFLAKYFSGEQGDLFLKLRNKGLIYRLSSDYTCFNHESLFNIVFETSKEKIKEILEILKDDILVILKDSVSQNYINSYKKNIDYYNDEKMPQRMSYVCHRNLIEFMHYGKIINISKKQSNEYKSNLTVDGIKNCANKIFNKNNKMFVTVLGNVTKEFVPDLSYFKQNFLISEEKIDE